MVYLTLGFVALFQTKKEKTLIRKKKTDGTQEKTAKRQKGKARKKRAKKQKNVSGVFDVTISTSLLLKCAIELVIVVRFSISGLAKKNGEEITQKETDFGFPNKQRRPLSCETCRAVSLQRAKVFLFLGPRFTRSTNFPLNSPPHFWDRGSPDSRVSENTGDSRNPRRFRLAKVQMQLIVCALRGLPGIRLGAAI